MEQLENSPIKAHLHGQQKQWLSGLEVKLQLGISQGFYFAKYFQSMCNGNLKKTSINSCLIARLLQLFAVL